MSIPSMPPKAPGEVLDYKIDMTAELAGRLVGGGNDTITGVTWTAPIDITVESNSFNDNTATVWLMGGVLGSTYEVAAQMQTSGGRTYHRSFKLSIKDR